MVTEDYLRFAICWTTCMKKSKFDVVKFNQRLGNLPSLYRCQKPYVPLPVSGWNSTGIGSTRVYFQISSHISISSFRSLRSLLSTRCQWKSFGQVGVLRESAGGYTLSETLHSTRRTWADLSISQSYTGDAPWYCQQKPSGPSAASPET